MLFVCSLPVNPFALHRKFSGSSVKGKKSSVIKFLSYKHTSPASLNLVQVLYYTLHEARPWNVITHSYPSLSSFSCKCSKPRNQWRPILQEDVSKVPALGQQLSAHLGNLMIFVGAKWQFGQQRETHSGQSQGWQAVDGPELELHLHPDLPVPCLRTPSTERMNLTFVQKQALPEWQWKLRAQTK